ncbi:Peptidase family C25 [anaerobic digester metagenome]
MQPNSPKFALIIKDFFMRVIFVLMAVVSMTVSSFAQTVEYTYRFSDYNIQNLGDFQTIVFDGTQQYGVVGEPTIPYMQVSLLLPPGTEVSSVEYILENETAVPGKFNLPPVQPDVPYSIGSTGKQVRTETVYSLNEAYPQKYSSTIVTQYLNGYSFALGKFTPVRWNPATGSLSYFSNVRIIVHTAQTANSMKAFKNINSSDNALLRVRTLAQNDAMMDRYPAKEPMNAYQMLIITPLTLKSGFEPLKNYYDSIGLNTRIATTDSIYDVMTGNGIRTRIRNYIIQEYQNNSIEYVLIGGDVNQIGARGFYCYVISGAGYEDDGIPADLYFSALDGTFDEDGDGIYGEALQDSVDLLPEVAIGRFPVETAEEVENLVNKTINYQKFPIISDMNKIILLGEMLLDTPLTMGQDYLELLIDNHNNNGYTTSGIPSATNSIDTIYDQWDYVGGYPSYEWDMPELTTAINAGSSFIYHVGHSAELYMMRMSDMELNSTTFAALDGTIHSYGLLYSHGCMCGSFDWDDCIAELSLKLDNYLAACVVNSRYGWFNEGQTEGPSQHLNREFVNAIYNPSIKERHIGEAFIMSKIATAPWVDLAGEYEFGAQRWVHYDNNLLGDPALRMWIDAVEVGVGDSEHKSIDLYPNPSDGNIVVTERFVDAQLSVFNAMGELVYSGQIVNQNVDLTQLSAGLYLLQINDGQKIFGGKVLIR